MRKIMQRFLASHSLSAVLAFFGSLILLLTPASRRFEDELARRIEFNTREALGKSPTISETIKVFAYDDKTAAAEFSQETLSIRDWAYIIRALAVNKPQRIVFDKIFSFPDKNPAENQFFVDTVKETGVDVYAAAFGVEHKLLNRLEVSGTTNCFTHGAPSGLESYTSDKWHFYGPAPQLMPAFKDFGHIVIDERSRYPIAFSKNGALCLPLLIGAVSQNFSFTKTGIVINGKELHPDMDGALQPNLIPKLQFNKKAYSLKPVLDLARLNRAVPIINPGDTVLILPNMYTGNTDFKNTPLGVMEGGYFHLANLNSMITGKWLQFWGYNTIIASIILLLTTSLGAIVIRLLSPAFASFATLGIVIIFYSCAMWVFIAHGIMSFWLLPISAFLATVFGGIVERAAILERHAQKVSTALEGLVPYHVLQILKRNPAALHLRPKRIHVSIMFIDVEGFSVRFEGVDPDIIFASLQKQLQRLGTIVHEHGGIIDKTMGDGLLAFFGHSYDHEKEIKNHAAQSVQCALAIQREWAERMTQSSKHARNINAEQELLPMPLRIGINSGHVYLGNLGSGARVDFTIVGDAVNFAKRLEDSANSFRVMIGASVKESIHSTDNSDTSSSLVHTPDVSFRKCMLQIKHHSELIEAWECSPFVQNPTLLRSALAVARGQVNRNGARTSWRPKVPLDVLINGNLPGKLIDFSLFGLCIEANLYYARKVQISIDLATNLPELRTQLSKLGLSTLLAEVRWGEEIGNTNRHGLRILNLATEQRQKLCELLCSTIELMENA